MNDGVVDPFRDTPIRYLGYANEIGEAFRHFLGHRLVLATYAVASAYASADAAYKGFEEYTHTRNVAEGGSPHLRRVSFVVLDTMLWQGLASVLIPGLAVNRVVWATSSLMTYVGPRLSNAYRAVGPTGAGLASIPFMIRPIDDAVTKGMDAYVRPTFSVWSQIN